MLHLCDPSISWFLTAGWRIGKGEGYADMEYAMMVSMGAVREDTVVITAVHDCQVTITKWEQAAHFQMGPGFHEIVQGSR